VSSELLGSDVIASSKAVRVALDLSEGAQVLRSQRRTLANDLPIAFGASFHSMTRFPDYAERRAEIGSTTATYKSYGIADYVRQSTQMQARPATADEARMLRQHPDLSVIVIRAVDADLDGVPLSYSEVIWAAGRVTFTMSNDADA
jgi:GntR family phosphonate transport system transcriptional regulator